MPGQPIPHVGSATAAPYAGNRASRAWGAGPAVEERGARPVAVLSAAALRMARAGYNESQAKFAARAGLAAAVVKGAEDGTGPVWWLPYPEFEALADAVAGLNPWLRTLFETAAACDLLLWCVLDGDQVFATDVLTQPGTRDLARSLLRLAITGKSAAHAPGRGTGRPRARRLLTAAQVALLHERAAALAASGSPDAWVGRLILAAGWGDQS